MRHWTPRIMLIALACVVLGSSLAMAQGTPMTSSDPEMQKLQEELKAIREELSALRTELRQVSAQLRAMQVANRPTPPTPPTDDAVHDIPLDGSPYRGPKDAPVTIVEFVSFTCGFCIKEEPTLASIMKEYPDQVRVVFKHFPRGQMDAAPHAASALAYKQLGNEGFWKMYEKIIAGGPRKVAKDDLRKYAEDLGMDLAEFDSVIGDDQKMSELINSDKTLGATKFGVRGTPTVFINGKRLAPTRSMDNYKLFIANALKDAKDEKKGG